MNDPHLALLACFCDPAIQPYAANGAVDAFLCPVLRQEHADE